MNKTSFSLAELAHLTDSILVGDREHQITNVESLESASSSDASFLASPLYEKAMMGSSAGVVFVASETPLPPGRNFLIATNPSLSFQKVVELFHGETEVLSGFEGIHPTAVIHPTAFVAPEVQIGPHSVIDKNVSIATGTRIGTGCYIGPYTSIGINCLFHSNVTIREKIEIGDRVILHPGVVIGSCGFGYLTNAQGKHTKLKQLGNVKIGNDVEIGANTTIDRARFKTTEIKKGTKIDNLVQIGHGVVIGEDNLIIAQTGIAGSSSTGQNVILAGQVAVAGHIHIGNRIIVAGRSAVTKSLTKPGKYGGVPAISLGEHNRMSVHLRKITSYADKIKKLELYIDKTHASMPQN